MSRQAPRDRLARPDLMLIPVEIEGQKDVHRMRHHAYTVFLVGANVDLIEDSPFEIFPQGGRARCRSHVYQAGEI